MREACEPSGDGNQSCERHAIAIRDCKKGGLIRYQTEGYSDAVVEKQQTESNRFQKDLFRSKYGLLNDRANMRVFADDTEAIHN